MVLVAVVLEAAGKPGPLEALHRRMSYGKGGLPQVLAPPVGVLPTHSGPHDSQAVHRDGIYELKTKRRPGQRLDREQKMNNWVLNRVRSVVELVIAQVKTWWILHTGFRRLLGLYGRVFSSGVWVGVFGCGAPLMNKPPKSLFELP